MSSTSRVFAFIAYLLLAIGWLVVMLVRRNDSFAVYHARQSLRLTLVAIALPLAWVVLGYIVTIVPLAGPFVAVTAFTLVLAGYFALVIAWGAGLINAARGRSAAPPFFGV